MHRIAAIYITKFLVFNKLIFAKIKLRIRFYFCALYISYCICNCCILLVILVLYSGKRRKVKRKVM